MIFLIFIVSMIGFMVSLVLPGWEDLVLLAVPSAFASIILLVSNEALRRERRLKDNSVVVDGSNVMHWHGGKPNIETVKEVIKTLRSKGFNPGVVFDANAGHVLTGKYKDEHYFRRALRLPPDHVIVVPKGTPADPLILSAARACKGRVVSNDRFRDWMRDHPELSMPGYVIKGGYRSGKLWLGLPEKQA